jgi:L-rhamnose mutarotase
MKRFCVALDLKNDNKLIEEYETLHQNVWPEIKRSIAVAGITMMEIYRTGNRLFMIMETTDDFSFIAKEKMDGENEKVQEWEKLMWKFQQPLPWAQKGEKWVLMDKIFQL